MQIAHNYSVFDAQFHGKNLVALKTDHKFSIKSVEYQSKTYRIQIPVSEFIGIDTFVTISAQGWKTITIFAEAA